jgi:hypothetical protein
MEDRSEVEGWAGRRARHCMMIGHFAGEEGIKLLGMMA